MSDIVSGSSTTATVITTKDEHSGERALWWLAVVGAVASVAFGVAMLVWPHETLYVAAILFGVWLMVHGVVNIVRALTPGGDAGRRALDGILGVLFVAAGVVCLRNVLISLLTIVTVIGLTWIIGGVVQIGTAVAHGRETRDRVVVGVLGAIAIIGGLIVLLWPGLTLLAMVVFTGIWLIVMGVVQFYLVLRNRPARF
jgi:uncharacterized membrane protein HdeD (DUF308 family)